MTGCCLQTSPGMSGRQSGHSCPPWTQLLSRAPVLSAASLLWPLGLSRPFYNVRQMPPRCVCEQKGPAHTWACRPSQRGQDHLPSHMQMMMPREKAFHLDHWLGTHHPSEESLGQMQSPAPWTAPHLCIPSAGCGRMESEAHEQPPMR